MLIKLFDRLSLNAIPCIVTSLHDFVLQLLERTQSIIPHVRPELPRSVTHNHDEDFSDDDSDEKNAVKNGNK